ncbi:MAG: fibronectin type III domain-containing protein [Candidatus Binatia bacterium]
MSTRRAATWSLLWLLLGWATASDAATRSASVRWSPSASGSPAGYHVYVHAVGQAYGAPLDAGLPTPAGDGSLSYTVPDLDTAITYVFGLRAYAGDGSESALSNEITLTAVTSTTTTTTTSTSTSTSTTTTRPPTTTTSSTLRPPTTTSTTRPSTSTTTTTLPAGPGSTTTTSTSTTSTTLEPAECAGDADCADEDACTEHERCTDGRCVRDAIVCEGADACATARCDAQAGCVTEPLPDGTACDGSDPCVPGVCNGGACTQPAADVARGRDEHYLAVSRFVLRAEGRRRRLVAQASFAVRDDIDPTATGGTLEVRTDDGAVLYRADVPGTTFRPNRSRRAFRYTVRPGRRAPAQANGLSKLVVKTSGTTADVTVAGSAPEFETVAREASLQWVLRVGTQCVRAPDMSCQAADAVTRCE